MYKSYFHRKKIIAGDNDTLPLEGRLFRVYPDEANLEENLGIDMSLFMPPSGSYGAQTLEAAESLGYTTIMWSKDTIDWRDHNTSLILSRATKNMQNGDIILMHPTENTREALQDIVKSYQNSGFSVVTVSENIA